MSFVDDIEGAPPSLSGCTKLTNLDFTQSSFEPASIPDEWGTFSQLEKLDLHANTLTGSLPESFRGLTNLKTLDIGRTAISGTLPDYIAELTALGK